MKKTRRILAAALAAGALFLFAGCDASTTESSASRDASSSAAATESAAAEQTQSSAPAQESTSDAAGTETAAAQESAAGEEMTSDLPAPDPAYQTLSVTGTISSIEDSIIYITDEGSAAEVAGSSEIGAVEAEDCILINAQTGAEVDDDALHVGDRVQAYVGLTMTRSIPPQAPCYAMFTDLPADGPGTAHYVRALRVTPNEDGSVSVLNQNADVLVTIPADLAVEVFDEAQTASIANITDGTRMIAWWDAETRSIPAQATATRVMLDIDD